MKTIKFSIEGVMPIMFNNPQTVNPFNEFTKKMKPLTSKKKKTDEDADTLNRLKFEASIYMKDGVYIIPAEQFWKSICTAAKEEKLGTIFEKNLNVFEDAVLDFPEKNMSPSQLYEDGRHVDVRDASIRGSRVVACRFILNEWKTNIECWYDEQQINEDQVIRFVEIAGKRYGVGTYRKRFGRFKCKVIQ